MNRFDLDAAQALKVLRRMSQVTRTQRCVVPGQVINMIAGRAQPAAMRSM
jgi:hypothetical protein